MTIGSVGGSASLNPFYQAQAAQAVSLDAQAFDMQTEAGPEDATASAASSNLLTGTGMPTLDTQTLQALLDLSQQDGASGSDASQAGAGGRTGSAHHHHHHHGAGMGQSQASDPASSATALEDASSTDAFGVPASNADNNQNSLAAALAQG